MFQGLLGWARSRGYRDGLLEVKVSDQCCGNSGGYVRPEKRTPGMWREEQNMPSKSQMAFALSNASVAFVRCGVVLKCARSFHLKLFSPSEVTRDAKQETT